LWDFYKMEKIVEQTEPYQRKIRSKHRKMKIALIGKGGNKHKSMPYTLDPDYNRSKSAPPLGEDYEIEEDKLIPKKIKMKIKVKTKK